MLKLINQTRSFFNNEKGATAIEFAVVILPLLTIIFAIIEMSYKSMLQSELDDRLYQATYSISTNNVPIDNAQQFMDEYFCPEIGTVFLNCSDIEIGVETVTGRFRLNNFTNQSIIGDWNLGNTNDAVLIEINYPVSNIVHPIAIADVITRNNKKYYRSRGVARREPLLSNSIRTTGSVTN